MKSKNQIFIDLLPIKTERLYIRKTSLEDIDLLLKMDKQEITQKYLGGVKNKTREERIAFINRKLDKFNKGLAGQLTICLNDGTPIGFSGLSINEDENSSEIGYIFDYDYCNKGYCTESCKKLIDIAFNILDLDYIFADTVEGNNSSKRVLEKLGFIYKDSSNRDGVTFLNYYLYNKRDRKNE